MSFWLVQNPSNCLKKFCFMQKRNRRYFKVKRTALDIRPYHKKEDLAVLKLDPYTRAVVGKLKRFKEVLFY